MDHVDAEAGDVALVAAVRRHERVDDGDVRSGGAEGVHDVRADEAQPTGDDAAPPGEPRRRCRGVVVRRGAHGTHE
jgi:hypothetical protein